MQFVVPQFIDVENKIIGPIATRQFVLLVTMVVIAFVLFRAAPLWLFVLGSILDILIFGAFSFVKVNGQPFHLFVLVVIQTFKRPSLRVWDKKMTRQEMHAAKEKQTAPKTLPSKKEFTSKSRLAELSLIVDTGGAYHDESLFQAKSKERYIQSHATPK